MPPASQRVTLTTTRQAVVTANVAGKTATVTVAPESAHRHHASRRRHDLDRRAQPASFTFGVGAAANIRDVRVDWGDGSVAVAGRDQRGDDDGDAHLPGGRHSSRSRATATDAAGFSESVSTTVTVLPGAAAVRHRLGVAATPPSISRSSCARRSPATRRRSSATSGSSAADATAPTTRPRPATRSRTRGGTPGTQDHLRQRHSRPPARAATASATSTSAEPTVTATTSR